ncbi:MAG: L-fucokinase, partial [Spirochaetia bacterium]
MRLPSEWDYLIVTASNERQASWYRQQLELRVELGLLAGFHRVLVVADPQGKRVGSGGSTILCLLEIIRIETARRPSHGTAGADWTDILAGLRILILHSGGDSRRLPAYAACGKLFVPLPVPGRGALPLTLLDLQLPLYQALPAPRQESCQIVIASGDALLLFDPRRVQLVRGGLVGLGILSTPAEASHHGVFCAGVNGAVKRFLQKPSVKEQEKWGAVDGFGQTLLDSGVFSFDSSFAARLLSFCGATLRNSTLAWGQEFERTVLSAPLDFYRELCCALGSETTLESFVQTVRSSGSDWPENALQDAFKLFSGLPFSVEALSQSTFLHFGTNTDLIESAYTLLHEDTAQAVRGRCLLANNRFGAEGKLRGENSLVEGCSIEAGVVLAGENLLVGADVKQAVALAAGMCVDVQPGNDPQLGPIWYVRCYGSRDTFKAKAGEGLVFCGMDMARWLDLSGATPDQIWPDETAAAGRQLWDARLFPAEPDPAGFVRWLWMLDPGTATEAQTKAWRAARRYSMAEILENADPQSFAARRRRFRREELTASRRQLFRIGTDFSAPELAYLLADDENPAVTVALLLEEGYWCSAQPAESRGPEPFMLPRILHTVASAVMAAAQREAPFAARFTERFWIELGREARAWLVSLGLQPPAAGRLGEWCDRLKALAFDSMGRVILSSAPVRKDRPKSRLRSDEIVWGRAPARFDLGGGWSDTPPYSL